VVFPVASPAAGLERAAQHTLGHIEVVDGPTDQLKPRKGIWLQQGILTVVRRKRLEWMIESHGWICRYAALTLKSVYRTPGE
jgi:hypothetical protein